MSDIFYIQQISILRKRIIDLKSKRDYAEKQNFFLEQQLGILKEDTTIADALEKNKGTRIFSEIIEYNYDKVKDMTFRQGIIYLLESEAGTEKEKIPGKSVQEITGMHPRTKAVFSRIGIDCTNDKISESCLCPEGAEKPDMVKILISNINYFLICRTQEQRAMYERIEPSGEVIKSLDSGISELEIQVAELDNMIKRRDETAKIDESIIKIKEKIRLSSLLAVIK